MTRKATAAGTPAPLALAENKPGATVAIIIRPVEKPWARHAYWMYTVSLGDSVRRPRDEIMKMLAAKGIEKRPDFYPVHQMPPYSDAAGPFPVADRVSARGINLPTHALLTQGDVERVAEALIESARH